MRLACGLLLIALLAAGGTTAAPRSDIGGPFQLTDQNGWPANQQRLAGQPSLLYFGYTTCPDICPTDLARMARLVKAVRASSGAELRPIFVTLDPERDTPQRLQTYMSYFGPTFLGLSGTPGQIAQITEAYHVYYKKVPRADGGYLLDHSTFLFLLDDQGRYLDHFGRGTDEAQIVDRINQGLRGDAVRG